LLDQHFRSHPHIIDFSNRTFYDGDLRIMTQRPSREGQSAIHVVRTAGKRAADSSVNRAEVEAVAEIVTDLVQRTQSDAVVPSIGIVSPFRDHVNAICDRIFDDLPTNIIERYGIVVGTAHSLQGDEKDVVVFSTSIDADSHPASLRFLETPNLFNVAITRARKKLIVVSSVSVDELPPGLLRDFLHHAAGNWQPAREPQGAERGGFRAELIERLRQQPTDCWTGFRSAGVRIHIVAGHGDRCVAVLCDGYPAIPPDEDLDALTAHRILDRAGWPVVRIPHRSWQQDWFACVEAISKQLRT